MKIKNRYSFANDNFFQLKNLKFNKKGFFGEEKEINSLNFRSDEFIKEHKNFHVVFTGCSVTSGVGLLQEEIWAKKLYNKILLETKCSGYFNLSISATGACDQIFNLFKYFKEYGNPNVIFFMIPDNERFYDYDKNLKMINNIFVEEKERETILFVYQQYYMMLEDYCKSNNIELFSFTYNLKVQEKFYKKFKTFYAIDYRILNNFIFDYIEENKNFEYTQNARDDSHMGTAYHEYWSNFIYEKYKKNKKKN